MANSEPAGTILVVEDAESVRKLICAMLAQSGYRCLEAEDGIDALQVLDSRADGFDLVLTDLIMPNMSGPELARHIIRLRPELRILFMSGYSDDPVVRHLEQTPSLFLSKPFTASALVEKVRLILEHPWAGLAELIDPPGVQ